MRKYLVIIIGNNKPVELEGTDVWVTLTAAGILTKNVLGIEWKDHPDENKFHDFCIKTFSEFYELDPQLVLHKFIDASYTDSVYEFYDHLHTFSPFQLIEEITDLLKDEFDINFQETYRRKYEVLLYHGSNINFNLPDLQYAKSACDFGRGFYLTPNKKKAENAARWRSKKSGGNPVLHVFKFNILASRFIQERKFDGVCKEWAEDIAAYRLGLPRPEVDLLIGPVADDEVYNYTQSFINGQMSLEDFLIAAKPYEGYVQYAFKSEKSLQYLEKKPIQLVKTSIF